MEQIQALVRKFPKLSTVAVVLLLVLSSLMILTAPFKVQVAGVRDLVEPHIAETLDSLELEKIDDALLKEDLISAEGMDYIEEQLVNAFLSLLPGSVEVEVSLADIEYLCAQYADTRSFVESSAVTTDVIQQAILNIVLENAFVSNALETEEQIFRVINTYRAAYYVLVLLSLISIALVCFRRKIAVLVWMVPAALISLGLAVLSTVGDAYIANHIYEQMYLRFPAGM
ncbi:MAG: hypothetical protein Q4B54_11390, partial [Coriobacteriales bacterium]|nr:hypothetical protein [Coriobacteriales bacterium]